MDSLAEIGSADAVPSGSLTVMQDQKTCGAPPGDAVVDWRRWSERSCLIAGAYPAISVPVGAPSARSIGVRTVVAVRIIVGCRQCAADKSASNDTTKYRPRAPPARVC